MKVRLPAEMRDRIAELAKLNGRSMNAEIIARLEETLSDPRPRANLTEHQKELRSLVMVEIERYMKEKKCKGKLT